MNRGLGQMTPQQQQAQAAGLAWANSQIADSRMGLTTPSAQTQAALQQFQVASAAVAPPTTTSTNTPYIIAGIVGVVVLGGLIYAATK